MIGSPCKGCERRAPRCHGRCKEYAEFRAKCDAAIAARVADQLRNEISDTKRRTMNYERYQVKKGHKSNVYR